MDSDTEEAARAAVDTLPDPRIRFFFDPGQRSGKDVAASLGNNKEVAWDFYLFYLPGKVWAGLPPQPDVYMHQLADSWADPKRLFQDQELEQELRKTMETLLNQEDTGDG